MISFYVLMLFPSRYDFDPFFSFNLPSLCKLIYSRSGRYAVPDTPKMWL